MAEPLDDDDINELLDALASRADRAQRQVALLRAVQKRIEDGSAVKDAIALAAVSGQGATDMKLILSLLRDYSDSVDHLYAVMIELAQLMNNFVKRWGAERRHPLTVQQVFQIASVSVDPDFRSSD